jgi:AraC family transcriptional regulator
MPRSASAGVSATRVSEGPSNSLDVVRLSKLIDAASASLDGDRETAKGYMLRAAELLRGFRKVRCTALTTFSRARGGLAAWQRKRVVAYVEANIGTNIRATDLARIARLSKGHFFRAFRESFGEPPMAYVVKRRVVLGQELMRRSRAPLSEIALACGMCDQPHFTRLFHRIVGVSPGLWRRQFAGGCGVSTTARADGLARYDSVN